MLKTCPSSSGLIENITNPVLENSVNTASSSLTGPRDVLLYKIMKCGVTWKKNDFSAHRGYPMEAISSEQSQKRPKNNLTKSISPWAQERPAAWHRTCDLHEAVPIIHRCLENTQQEQASSKGAAMPLTLKAHPFLLLFAIWITWMLLTCWLHLQACAIKGVRMRSSPRFAERRLDLMIWAH